MSQSDASAATSSRQERTGDRAREEGARPAGPAPATQSPAVQRVLALQQSAGNAAVSRLLATPAGLHRAPAAAPPAPAKGAPGAAAASTKSVDVASFGLKVKPGGQGRTAGKPDVRPMDGAGTKLFKGDTVTFTLGFDGPASEHRAGYSIVSAGDGIVEDAGRWVDDATYQWDVRFTRVGDKRVTVTGAGGTTFTEHFTVVADVLDFIAACVEAQARINARFAAAAEKLGQVGVEYNKAYAQQEGDLKDVDASEKLVADLLWGAFFAGLGGAAGGAVGGWIKRMKDGAFKNDDWLIDTGKDVAKFATRSFDRLRGAGGPSTSGDATASATDPGKARGDRKASGDDPFEFVSGLQIAVGAEGRKANTKLAQLIAGAREARDANSKADFDQDPVSLVEGGVDLSEIEAMVADKKAFLKQLWKAWLGAYAWKMEYAFGGGPPMAEEQIGRKLRKKIHKAAAECGEDGDAWIREFGLPARLRAEKEAEEAFEYWTPPMST